MKGKTALECAQFHVDEMELWASGHKSYTNLPLTPEVIAVMDAQEVVKHSAAAVAYAALHTATTGGGQ